MSSRAVKIAVSLLLTVSLFCCSFSVFAVQYDEDYTVPQDQFTETLLYYIYLTLRSWEINISFDEFEEWTTETSEWMWMTIQEWLSEIPSINSWSQLIFPWKVTMDSWGRLIGNNSFLEDIQDFADWLVVKFALASNTENIVVQGFHYVDDDNGNRYYAGLYNSAFEEISTVVFQVNGLVSTPSGTEKIYFNNGQNYVTYNVTSRADGRNGVGSFGLTWYNLENGNYVARGSAGLPLSRSNDWTIAYVKMFYFPGGYDLNNNYHNEGVYFCYTETLYNESFVYDDYLWLGNITEVQTDGSVVIITGDIDIPDDIDPDDSILIDGDDTYIQIEWPESISVDNLPAVISPNEIQNPEIDQIYTNVPAFFQMANDTMYSFKQIIFRMPDEVLNCIYAVLSIGVIFGFLRIMREH